MERKRRLALIYPNQKWQKEDENTSWDLNPTTLCVLGEMVKHDVEVKVIDAQFYNMSLEKFSDEIKTFSPDYVGISVMTSEYSETLDIAARVIKEINERIIVIAGGVHVTMEHERVIQNMNVDYAVRGEGEYVLQQLIKYLNGTGEFPSEGLVFRKNGEIIRLPQAFVEDLTKLPWPDYSLVTLKDYIFEGPRLGPQRPPEFPYIRMSVSRGCPFGCSFCQVAQISGKKVRTRDPEDVVNEIEFLKKQYGIKSIIFDDDDLIAAPGFLKKMLELLIEREVNIKFIFIAFAIFLLTDELLDLLARAGCVGVNVAIESGNKRVLKEIIHKPLDLEKVVEMIEKVKNKGLFCIANFIIGFPGESWNEIRESIQFAESCGADYIKIFVAVPLRGTELWNKAIELNALAQPDDIKVEWRYSQIVSKEWTAKDISILRAYEWDRINFSSDKKRKRVEELWGVSEEEMEKVRKRTRDALIL